MGKPSVGEISDLLTTLGMTALSGQPNAAGSAAYSSAVAAKQASQGTLAQERQAALAKEADKKRKKGLLGSIAGTVAGAAASAIPVVGPFIAPVASTLASGAVSGQGTDPAQLAGAAVQGGVAGVGSLPSAAPAASTQAGQPPLLGDPLGQAPPQPVGTNTVLAPGGQPATPSMPGPIAGSLGAGTDHVVTVTSPSGHTVTVGPSTPNAPGTLPNGQTVEQTRAGQVGPDPSTIDLANPDPQMQELFARQKALTTGTSPQPQGASDGQIQGQAGSAANAVSPQGQGQGQELLTAGGGPGGGGGATSPAPAAASGPVAAGLGTQVVDPMAVMQNVSKILDGFNPSTPTPTVGATSAPAQPGAPAPPQGFAGKAQAVLAHPITQALLAGLQEGLSGLGQPNPYQMPSVSTPGLHPDIQAQVDNQFMQTQRWAAEDARANAATKMDKTKLGLEQRRTDLEAQRLKSGDAHDRVMEDLQRQQITQSGQAAKAGIGMEGVRAGLEASGQAVTQQGQQINAQHQVATETETGRHNQAMEASAAVSAKAAAARVLVDSNKSDASTALRQQEDLEKALAASDTGTLAAWREVNAGIRASNKTGDTPKPEMTEKDLARWQEQARAAVIGHKLLYGHLDPNQIRQGERVAVPQQGGDDADGFVIGQGLFISTETASDYYEATGIKPSQYALADVQNLKSKGLVVPIPDVMGGTPVPSAKPTKGQARGVDDPATLANDSKLKALRDQKPATPQTLSIDDLIASIETARADLAKSMEPKKKQTLKEQLAELESDLAKRTASPSTAPPLRMGIARFL